MQRAAVVVGPVLVGMLALGLAGAGGADPSPQLQGASAVLKALTQRQTPEQRAQGDSGPAVLRRQIAVFTSAAAKMAPAEAARQWISLYERYLSLDSDAISEDYQFTADQLTLGSVVAALPPPAAWPDLNAELRRRIPNPKTVSDHCLLLLAAQLTEDNAAVDRELVSLARLTKDQQGQGDPILQMQETHALRSGDPARIFAVEQARILTTDPGSLNLPDLVALVGAPKAEILLRKALLGSGAIQTIQGAATERLARKLAIELLPQLKTAQWPLAQSIEAAPLFEALERRFPPLKAPASNPTQQAAPAPDEVDPNETAHASARQYYCLAMVGAGRQAEALRAATELRRTAAPADWETQLTGDVDAVPKPAAAAELLRTLLAKDAKLPLWGLYVSLTSRASGPEGCIKAMRAALQRPDLPPDAYHVVQRRLYHALLAADRVDEGVAELRKILNERPAKADRDGEESPAQQMVRLGQALGRTDLVEDGLAVMRRDRKDDHNTGTEIADALVRLGRDGDAEKELIEQLRGIALAVPPGAQLTEGNEQLIRLAGIYYRGGRWADILALLREAPNWPGPDLLYAYFMQDGEGAYLGQAAAAALAHTGDGPGAVRILQTILNNYGGSDHAYALLAEIEGEKALPFLDELAARDRFEERPLIWKALILLKAGKPEPAEAAARAALAIDPLDGDAGAGDRLRAYAVLADIREARGDRKEAEAYRTRLRAIRAAEKADELYQAGLVSRSVKGYQEALAIFPDAACIQSRLALRLAETGEMKEAAPHFQRAFELLPESTGRFETSGENLFGGKEAAAIGERVFSQMLRATPERPQIYYLLASLRSSQGHDAEAIPLLKEAVKRDPGFLSAWKLLLSAGDQVRLPREDRDAASLAIMQLDPLNRHYQNETFEVTGLKALWETFDRPQSALSVAEPTSLLPLPAAKAAQEKAGDVRGQRVFLANREFAELNQPSQARILRPGAALLAQQSVMNVVQILEGDIQMRKANAQ